jgi:hypothetical protein
VSIGEACYSFYMKQSFATTVHLASLDGRNNKSVKCPICGRFGRAALTNKVITHVQWLTDGLGRRSKKTTHCVYNEII